MASIIKSDNGVSSGITGIVQSADSSGQLALQTTTSSGIATTAVTIDNNQNATFAGKVASASSLQLATNGTTTAVTIDTNQNVGLGVTPQSWNTYAALEISRGNGGYVVNNASAGFVAIGQNLYYNSGYKYANSQAASLYYQQGGVHVWQNASSGTAGNAITFTQAMTLNSSGNLVFAQNGGGVQFTNSSALNNSVLNDYETGTFTPQVYAGGSPAYSSYGAQIGNYTKIGNTVSYQIYISAGTRTSATGSLTIVGLPFVTLGTTYTYHTAAMYFQGNYSGAPQNYIPYATTYINIGYTTAGAFIQFTSTNLNGNDMILCGTYKATF